MQSHSCLMVEIGQHFIRKKPEIRLLYEQLIQMLGDSEAYRISSVKNAILVSANTTFLAIKPKKNWLDIEFVLAEETNSFPIHKTVKTAHNRWAHFIRIQYPDELDQQLASWVRRAFETNLKQ